MSHLIDKYLFPLISIGAGLGGILLIQLMGWDVCTYITVFGYCMGYIGFGFGLGIAVYTNKKKKS